MTTTEHRGNPHTFQSSAHHYVTECICGARFLTYRREDGVAALRAHIAEKGAKA